MPKKTMKLTKKPARAKTPKPRCERVYLVSMQYRCPCGGIKKETTAVAPVGLFTGAQLGAFLSDNFGTVSLGVLEGYGVHITSMNLFTSNKLPKDVASRFATTMCRCNPLLKDRVEGIHA